MSVKLLQRQQLPAINPLTFRYRDPHNDLTPARPIFNTVPASGSVMAMSINEHSLNDASRPDDSFNDQLRRALDTISDRLHDELTRQFTALADELATANRASRDEAADAVRGAVEADAAARLATAVADAAARARDEAIADADTRVADVERRHADLEAQARTDADRARELEEQARSAAARADQLEQRANDADRQRRAIEEEKQSVEARARELEQQLHDAEERARAAQAESREAAERSLAAARQTSHGTDDVAAGERLVDAIRAIDRARSLSEILDTLVGCAGREAPRASVLLMRNGQLRGWRFLGFDKKLDVARNLDVPAGDAGIIADAARSGQAVSTDARDASAPAFAALPQGGLATAVPIALAGQVVAILYADQPDASDSRPPRWRVPLEILARHAASALEALTAFKAARSVVSQNAPPDRVDDHEAARRYARLLISEIKLYHENDIEAGVRDRNLSWRLGGEIERARTLYDERVPAAVRAHTNYFDAELVRTLASGDASLLG